MKKKRTGSVLILIVCIMLVFSALAVHASASTYSVTVKGYVNGQQWLMIGARVYFYPDITSSSDIHPILKYTNALGQASVDLGYDADCQINVIGSSEYLQYFSPSTNNSIPATSTVLLRNEITYPYSSPVDTDFSAPLISYDQNFGWRYMWDATNEENYLEFHNGVDLTSTSTGATLNGHTVKAIKTGEVIDQGWDDNGRGNYVVFHHPSTFLTMTVQHLDSISYAFTSFPFDVTEGNSLGTVGNTGYSFAPHLHVEIKGLVLAIPYQLADPFGYFCKTMVAS